MLGLMNVYRSTIAASNSGAVFSQVNLESISSASYYGAFCRGSIFTIANIYKSGFPNFTTASASNTRSVRFPLNHSLDFPKYE